MRMTWKQTSYVYPTGLTEPRWVAMVNGKKVAEIRPSSVGLYSHYNCVQCGDNLSAAEDPPFTGLKAVARQHQVEAHGL